MPLALSSTQYHPGPCKWIRSSSPVRLAEHERTHQLPASGANFELTVGPLTEGRPMNRSPRESQTALPSTEPCSSCARGSSAGGREAPPAQPHENGAAAMAITANRRAPGQLMETPLLVPA